MFKNIRSNSIQAESAEDRDQRLARYALILSDVDNLDRKVNHKISRLQGALEQAGGCLKLGPSYNNEKATVSLYRLTPYWTQDFKDSDRFEIKAFDREFPYLLDGYRVPFIPEEFERKNGRYYKTRDVVAPFVAQYMGRWSQILITKESTDDHLTKMVNALVDKKSDAKEFTLSHDCATNFAKGANRIKWGWLALGLGALAILVVIT